MDANKSAVHPVTTRADLFKKVYPNAPTHADGSLVFCPRYLDKDINAQMDYTVMNAKKITGLRRESSGRQIP